MNYTVQVNEVRTTNPESAVRAYASVTFDGAFKVGNIAILENRATGEPFISMPNYKTRGLMKRISPSIRISAIR
ncbi:MAG: septation protein SpoVG family protein [Anaerosacchariphilus sp.]